MILLTYATHNTGYFNALKESSERNNYKLVVIGYNEKWEGFTKRLEKILNYLKTNVDKDEIVCFVDAFDTIMLKDSKELEKKFKSMNTDKVVYSATMDNFMRSIVFGKNNDKDSNKEFNRLNGAPYIGYCHKIVELFSNLCKSFECKLNRDDQVLLTHYYNICQDCIILDHDANLFYNIELDESLLNYYVKLILKKNNDEVPLNNKYHKFINNEIILFNNNKPIILHGNANVNMDAFCRVLNLPKKIEEKREYFDYSTKTFLDKIFNIFLIYLTKFIHLILIIISVFGPYMSNNYYFLIGLIVFYISISVQWNIMNGNCIITVWENNLERKKDVIPLSIKKNDKEIGYVADIISKLSGINSSNVDKLIMIIPFINSLVCCFKLLNIINKTKK